MAILSAADLRAVSDAINWISEDHQRTADAVMRAVIGSSGEGVPTERLADEIADALEQVFESNAQAAAGVSADLYDHLRKESTGEGLGAVARTDREAEWTRQEVRKAARRHADDMEAFMGAVLERMDYEAKRAAGSTMFYNGYRDPRRPRFARVPTGAETCPWCVMLASRGFVYLGEDTAGKLDHYHPNCDCRVVPSFDSYEVRTAAGGVRRLSGTVIGGYDPDEWYARYEADQAAGRLKPGDVVRYSDGDPGRPRLRDDGDARAYADAASSVDDVQARMAYLRQALADGTLPGETDEDRQALFDDLVRRLRGIYRELMAESGVEYDRSGKRFGEGGRIDSWRRNQSPEARERIKRRVESMETVHEDFFTTDKSARKREERDIGKGLSSAEREYDASGNERRYRSREEAYRHTVGAYVRSLTVRGDIEIEDLAWPNKSELQAAKWFSASGYPVRIRKAKQAHSGNNDFLLDGVRWELKQPTTGNKRQVKKDVGRSTHQCNRFIVDLSRSPLGVRDVAEGLSQLLEDDDIDEILVLASGKCYRLSK